MKRKTFDFLLIFVTAMVTISSFSLGLSGSNLLLAAEAKLQAMVDKQTAHQDEEINFSIRILDAKNNIPAPKLPAFLGFDTFYSGRASHFTFINGKSNSITEFNYVLVPKSAGVFTISPIEITVDGQAYHTEAIQIEVLGQQMQAPQPVQPQVPQANQMYQRAQGQQGALPPVSGSNQTVPPNSQTVLPQDMDSNIFLRVNPSKRTVYSNEQLLLTYSLLTRYDTRYEGFDSEPETSGFWVEEFPIDRDLGKRTEILNDRKYVRADIKKLALFPTAPGEYVIKPGSIKASVQIEQAPSNFLDEFFNDSFFSNSGVFSRRADKVLSAQPMTIVVKPLPETDKPKNFNGTVGDFRMSSNVDKRAVNQNEPVTLQLMIEGEGNIETLSHPPVPELPDAKIYDADTKSEFFKVENLIAGKKTFEIILIPKLAGDFQIPPLEFSFFNPKIEKYVTLKTESYTIRVNQSLVPPPEFPKELGGINLPEKKEIRAAGKDIRFIHERILPKSHALKFILMLFILVNTGLTAACLVLIVKYRQDESMTTNRAFRRERLAKRNAEKLLRNLIQLSKKESDENKQAFFDEAERIMNQYLADKLNLSPQGLTQQLVAQKLTDRGVSDETLKKIEKFYEVCGLVRFAQMGTFETGSQEVLDSLRSILGESF